MPDAVRILECFGNPLHAAARAAKGDQPGCSLRTDRPILWAQGKVEAAIQVEKLTNRLVVTHDVDILCGYPEARFHNDMARKVFERVSAEHSPLLPGESCSGHLYEAVADGTGPVATISLSAIERD